MSETVASGYRRRGSRAPVRQAVTNQRWRTQWSQLAIGHLVVSISHIYILLFANIQFPVSCREDVPFDDVACMILGGGSDRHGGKTVVDDDGVLMVVEVAAEIPSGVWQGGDNCSLSVEEI